MSTNSDAPTSSTDTEPTSGPDATDTDTPDPSEDAEPPETEAGATEVEQSDESIDTEATEQPAVETPEEDPEAETPEEDPEAEPVDDTSEDENESSDKSESTNEDESSQEDTDEGESETDSEPRPAQTFEACAEAGVLTDALDSVSALVDECKFHVEPAGLEVRAVDPANVGMVDLFVGNDSFEQWQADGGVLGLNLNRLEDILGMANSGDPVHLELNAETRKLIIEIDGLEYTMALIDPASIRSEPDIPDMDLPAEILLNGEDLARGITAADMVSDHIAFTVDQHEEEFVVNAEGDTDDVQLALSDGDGDLVDATWGEAHSLFSLEYLKKMNKAIPRDATVTMVIGREFPVGLSYSLDAGTAEVAFMLAPRIQSD